MYSHYYAPRKRGDSSYDPAMPVVGIEVLNLDDLSKNIKLTAIVDSGSDGSFIPERHLHALGIESVRKAQVRGVSGIAYSVDMYMVKLKVGPFELYGTRVVGDKQNEIIVGRNLINQLVVTLNGLAEVVEVSN